MHLGLLTKTKDKSDTRHRTQFNTAGVSVSGGSHPSAYHCNHHLHCLQHSNPNCELWPTLP